MEIPKNVAKQLDKLRLNYEVEQLDAELLTSRIRRAGTTATQLAHCCYLKSADQTIRYIGSSNALCRLDAISEQLQETVSPCSEEEEQRINLSLHCESIHALPTDDNLVTLVDKGLFEADTLYLPCGNPGVFIQMPGSQLDKLYAGCTIVSADKVLQNLDAYEAKNCQQDIDDIQIAIRSYTALKIKKELTDTLSIPPLPVTAQRILKLRSDPLADVEDLAKIIALDPALAAQVVGWASSPYYSAPGNITSIQDAIVRVLGFQLVMNLALGLAVGKTLKYPQNCPYGIQSFWQQSIYCALTIEKLNREIEAEQRGSPGLCYLTGLLNNLGYLIIAHAFPDYFQQICQLQMANRHLIYCHIELHLLGVCRDQVASQLLRAWNLPAEVSTALRYQHAPDYTGHHHKYANLCLIAKRLIRAKGIGQIPASTIPVHLYERLGIGPDQIEKVMTEVFDASEDIQEMTRQFSRN